MMLCRILITLTFLSTCVSYKPIIYMHGIIAGPTEGDALKTFVSKFHPGTKVISIDAFNHLDSFKPMWEQVNQIKNIVQPIIQANPGGVHLVCFSQGGLVCRGLLSVLDHNIDTFIALSSPLAGQFGDTSYLKYLFPNYLKDNIYKYFYTESGQKHWSVANYWRDPFEEKLYRKYSEYLAEIDGERPTNMSAVYKKNFLKLKNLVLVGGPNDGVITPWQSSHFAFYDQTGKNITEYKNQKYYADDTFGLRTLDKLGRVHVHVIPGIQHTHWYSNQTVFDCCIKPWLT